MIGAFPESKIAPHCKKKKRDYISNLPGGVSEDYIHSFIEEHEPDHEPYEEE